MHEEALRSGLLPARAIPGFTGPWGLEERMDRFGVPAISAAVIDGGEIILVEAVGVGEARSSHVVTPDTLFQTASMSKSVTAYGALRLVQEGVLELDADLSLMPLPWNRSRNRHEGAVTLRRLLSHTAGINVPGFEGYLPSQALPTLCEMLAGEPPSNSPEIAVVEPPGDAFCYSGGGYLVVQALMEAAVGKPFDEVMREFVFEPLNMRRSVYAPLSSHQGPSAAKGHTENGMPMPFGAPIHPESAAGGLWSTAADLAKLVSELLHAARGDRKADLTTSLAQEMLAPGHNGFGLGVRVLGSGPDCRFNHGGATRGWHGQFIARLERSQGMVILTNSANGYLLWPEIERGIARSLGWPGWGSEALGPIRREPPVEEYTGDYSLAEGVAVRVEPDAFGIRLTYSGIDWPAVPRGPDRFELLELVGHLAFRRGTDGAIEGFDLSFDMPDWAPYRQWSFDRTAPIDVDS